LVVPHLSQGAGALSTRVGSALSRCSLYGSLTIFTDFGGSEIIPEQTPTVPAKKPLAGTLFLPPQKFEPFEQAVVEAAFRRKLKKRVRLVSVAGLRNIMLGERAAEVELTEGRVTS
jgi:hypothetical protein